MNDANINRIFNNAIGEDVGEIFPSGLNPLLCQIATEPLNTISLIDIFIEN